MQRIKQLGIPDLLVQLPALQELLFRLLSCQVMHHSVILLKFMLNLVLAFAFLPFSRSALIIFIFEMFEFYAIPAARWSD